jgi:hypothetical protein
VAKHMNTTIAIAVLTALAALIALALLAAPAPAQGRDVVAVDLTGPKPVPCAALSTQTYPTIAGGCLVTAQGKIDLTVQTMFGPLRFGRCSMAFNLLIGPNAEIWRDGYAGSAQGACGDLLPCRAKAPATEILSAPKLPWKGKITHTPNGYQATFDICLDTCLGRFEGKTTFTLAKHHNNWQMRATNTTTGTSGFQFNGHWNLTTPQTPATTSTPRQNTNNPPFNLH